MVTFALDFISANFTKITEDITKVVDSFGGTVLSIAYSEGSVVATVTLSAADKQTLEAASDAVNAQLKAAGYQVAGTEPQPADDTVDAAIVAAIVAPSLAAIGVAAWYAHSRGYLEGAAPGYALVGS